MRKKNMKGLLVGGVISITVLLLCCASCCKYESNLNAIKIRYFPPGTEFMEGIDDPAGMYGYDSVREKVIRKKKFLYELELRLDELTPCSNQAELSIDMRMFCLIEDKNGVLHELCLGEYFGIKYDEIYMEDNAELLQLIKSVSMDTYPLELIDE